MFPSTLEVAGEDVRTCCLYVGIQGMRRTVSYFDFLHPCLTRFGQNHSRTVVVEETAKEEKHLLGVNFYFCQCLYSLHFTAQFCNIDTETN
jgi:hypothetical protein